MLDVLIFVLVYTVIKSLVITFKPVDVAVHIISLVCWSQTIRPNSRLLAQISSTFIAWRNDRIP